ncbi:hypothetical protein [Arthrobacter oryzae]|uniref:hypothetical protein n=1 Tax=Arthrobacter oryzae TaxID=409290 RepID=UPI0011CD9DA3|nr:hypothetical protein [Arthrobacter oryzae]
MSPQPVSPAVTARASPPFHGSRIPLRSNPDPDMRRRDRKSVRHSSVTPTSVDNSTEIPPSYYLAAYSGLLALALSDSVSVGITLHTVRCRHAPTA